MKRNNVNKTPPTAKERTVQKGGQFSTVWNGGTEASWLEFKESFFNQLRVSNAWNLEIPATPEEERRERPSETAPQAVIDEINANHEMMLRIFNDEETGRGQPRANARDEDRNAYLTWRTDFAIRKKREMTDCADQKRKANSEAREKLLKWEAQQQSMNLKDVATGKVFYERFSSGVLTLIDKDFLKVSDFRGALARLDLAYIGESQSGQAAVSEHDMAMKMVYTKDVGFDIFVERLERLHTKLGYPRDLTRTVLQNAIANGDCEDLEQQLLVARSFVKSYEELKRVMREAIINLINMPDIPRAPTRVSTRESVQVASTYQNKKEGGDGKRPCSFCQKVHGGDLCWSQMTCGKCGQKGHPDFRCRSQEKPSKDSNKRKVNLVTNFEKLANKK
jgi:hypothetical protein